MKYRIRLLNNILHYRKEEGSLTVEAALVMPLFIYLIIAFLYFIQIFTVQEQIQSAITKMGLNLSRTSYILQDFPSFEEVLDFDLTIFGAELDIGLDELADQATSGGVLKLYAMKYLDTDEINRSCIQDGIDGISFQHSSIFGGEEVLDIIAEYTVVIPIRILPLKDMHMVQRVKIRNWTGHEVTAAYSTSDNKNEDKDIVYITDTGEVYHNDKNCSHIKLSISKVDGIPSDKRNDNGGKYYPCETCCKGVADANAAYYITSDGTRYHSKRECSKITRKVREIPQTEIGSRRPCKRCGK